MSTEWAGAVTASRSPSFLKDNLGPDFEVIIRTYDF